MPLRERYKCPMCGRHHIKDYMTFHHLLPTTSDSEKDEPSIYICSTCHRIIHYAHTNDELREKYNSLERILSSKKIQNLLSLYKYKADNCVFSIKRLKRLRRTLSQAA